MEEILKALHNEDTAAALSTLRSQSPSSSRDLNIRLLEADTGKSPRFRIAILSLLFNWPSTGGGIVHTAELARFLSQAGYTVRHIYAELPEWEMGVVSEPLAYDSRCISFTGETWNRDSIIEQFRKRVDEFDADAVIVTDSWNFKPLLAQAAGNRPYFLRLAALECICPLNNVRLVPDESGRPQQCSNTQLANRARCVNCVHSNSQSSSSLHEAERHLAHFFEDSYGDQIQRAFAEATGVLAVNPLIATLCEPYTESVHVIPSGFDAARFEHPGDIDWTTPSFRILFAGLTNEYMKGFHVLLEACQLLWSRRQDFELHVTADVGPDAPFLQYRGWQQQDSLPHLMSECHAIVVPTVAQEALGRTAVEGMAAARPVIASRIGGLPYTVTDGLTGLLAAPAEPMDLAAKIELLMDDRKFAKSLGRNGRTRFLDMHTWESVIERQYLPLFESLGART